MKLFTSWKMLEVELCFRHHLQRKVILKYGHIGKKKYTYSFHSVIDYVITVANDNDDKKLQVTGIAYMYVHINSSVTIFARYPSGHFLFLSQFIIQLLTQMSSVFTEYCKVFIHIHIYRVKNFFFQ